MDRNAARLRISAQINALAARRNATDDPAEKQAINDAIMALQDSRDEIDVAANDAIGAKMDALIARLEAVQNAHGLDAASAIGRAIGGLRGDGGGSG